MGIQTIKDSFTRPSNTTTYAAGDVVCNSTSSPVIMTFTVSGVAQGSSGVIIGATFIDGANKTLKGDFELWLFDTTVTMDNDNAVFTPTDAELQTLVGIIAFGGSPKVGDATADADGNAAYTAAGLNIPFRCVGTALFGILVVRNAYVPVSSGTFFARLIILEV